ncbi:uncharacterized protein LOC107010387 [Solanum pennellii]|uniref:Uncharacterized protein LOC107010387 n=1 Tax=Solanum pennellii TaxID=28526 RepID=A0ABM1G2N8_SOLPN|nr:uncharacterized protein LOC107010387 [Solanum pennellii]
MINDHFLMSLIQQTSDFIDLVKTKSIEVVAQHDERLLITILMLLFVCYILIFFSGRLWKKRKNKKLKKVLTRSMSIGLLHGGELALKRLIDYHKAKADFISLNSAETDLDALLNEEQPHFKKLQRCIAKMEMSGKESQAVRKLENAIKNAEPHKAYEFEMQLVETLIYQGEYSKALRCKCLDEKLITDARRPLYKAIIHISLGSRRNEEEAINYWKEFKQIKEDFKRPGKVKDAQLLKIGAEFDKFKSVVISLKEDIKEVNRKAKKHNKQNK